MSELITITMDNQTFQVPAGITILQAARQNHIEIPTICYHDHCTANGLCRICVVEVEGARTLQPACIVGVREGMVIHTSSERVIRSRRTILEMLASKLDMTYEQFVVSAMESFDTLLQMNSTCAVFAESEAIGMLAKGENKGDIAAAAHHSIGSRIASMVRRTAVTSENCIFTGGGALNKALVKALEEHLNSKIIIPPDPQSVVATGAALWAARKIGGR